VARIEHSTLRVRPAWFAGTPDQPGRAGRAYRPAFVLQKITRRGVKGIDEFVVRARRRGEENGSDARAALLPQIHNARWVDAMSNDATSYAVTTTLFRLTPATVRCIGDVHGEAEPFAAAVAAARERGMFVVQLGDLVDCGPDAPGCLRLMRCLIENRQGLFVRGNHDDRLFRHLAGRSIKPSPELDETLRQLAEAPDGAELTRWFYEVYPTMPYWLRLGDHLFAHAAFHPNMLHHAAPEAVPSKRHQSKYRALALYGETTGAVDEDGFPVRTYGWVDRIPNGLTVTVGHAIRSRAEPLTVVGALGGRAVFLDTGSGKEGKLSSLDLVPDYEWAAAAEDGAE